VCLSGAFQLPVRDPSPIPTGGSGSHGEMSACGDLTAVSETPGHMLTSGPGPWLATLQAARHEP
jgi:hypothetical protein